ncbi:type I secretion outer membrane protein TolC [Candidatus Termititenax aidoneus]|uniref:Type I secretion outer membrane protein TolC n=1 Tax=Termititenax aidoneus TaxID=2218524 RepID=A0A388TAH1_TERA1|nr:type I secretion outer membrane protein TolC [Candidatus Termititenax aidoneus]
MRGKYFLLAIFFLAAAHAQTFTLEQSIEHALQHSPQHKIIYKDREISKDQARQGYAAVLPQLSLGYTEATAKTPQSDIDMTSLDPMMQSLMGMLGGSQDETKTKSEEFSGQQLLFSFSGFAAVGASWSAGKLADYIYADASAQFVLSVRKAFFDLQAANDMQGLAADLAALMNTYARNAEIMFENGLISRKEMLDVRIQAYDAQKNLTNAEKAAAAARYNFNTTIGLPVDANARLAAHKVEIAEDILTRNFAAAALTEDAYRLRPSYLAAQEAVWLNQVDHFNAWAGSLPAVYYSYSKKKTAYDPESLMTAAGETETRAISAQWNFFAGGANWFKIHEKANNSDRQKEQLKLARSYLLMEIQSSLDDVKAQAQNILTARAQDSLAAESLRIARIDFESGNGTATQLNDAVIQQQSAGNNLIRALYDYEYARARLNYAAGQDVL